jgi:aspartate aminotransferase
MKPEMSKHFESRKPSAIRLAQIEFLKRQEAGDKTEAINTAIGNVSLPMYPAMQKRMFNLGAEGSPFKDGVVKYSATVGMPECNKAFLNVIAASGFNTEKLFSQITEGGSSAMELITIGVCGSAGTNEKPLLLIDAAYTNYNAMAARVGRSIVSVTRNLQDNGKFNLPDISEIEQIVKNNKPGAMIVIPYDNPTGHFYDHATMVKLGQLCVDNNMFMISDEAYRELHYVDHDTTSIWGLTNEEVPGIEGRRMSIETSSKVWNACGLRIGALVTDNQEYHQKSVAEATATLCSNVIGQYIFGSLAHESHDNLQKWFTKQRGYYKEMMTEVSNDFKEIMPDTIISSPDASIYSVVDVKNAVKPGFDALDFVMYCAQEGKVDVNGVDMTLLVSPMAGFYSSSRDENPGHTQMRIAYVASPDKMKLVPNLFKELLTQYESKRT